MSDDKTMLKQAADALALREKEAADLRARNVELSGQVDTLSTKTASHALQMAQVADLFENAGFDIGDKKAFVKGLQDNPKGLTSALKSAFDHFTAAPASGRGISTT